MKQHYRIATGKVVALMVLTSAPFLLGHAHSQDSFRVYRDNLSALNRSTPKASPLSRSSLNHQLVTAKTVSYTPPTRLTSTASNQSSATTLQTTFVSVSSAAPFLQDDEETNPVVLAVRESNPTTPQELMKAVVTMMNLDRYDEAQRYLNQIASARLDDNALFQLQRDSGTDLLLEISRSEKFDDAGRAFARQVLTTAYQVAREPARLDQLVSDLYSDNLRVQNAAYFEMEMLGQSAIPPILKSIQSGITADQKQLLVKVLVKLNNASIQPLTGALRANDENVRIVALEALGQLKARAAAHSMIRSALTDSVSEEEKAAARGALTKLFGFPPTKPEAISFLKQEVDSYLSGTTPGQPQLEGKALIWLWDDAIQNVQPTLFEDDVAALVYASEAAADLYELNPADEESRKLHVATLLETEKRIIGPNQPIEDDQLLQAARDMGVSGLEEMIKWSMKTDRVMTTIAGAELLGTLGTPDEVLQSTSSSPRLIVQLLRHNDRRVRFAATQSIMKMQPARSYKGSSWVVESLLFFISSAGEQRVLIGHPGVTQSQTLAGSLNQIGYQADTSHHGRDIIKQAVASSDYEMILISDAVTSPECNELIQQLRKDPRTSKLPIGLMAQRERLTRARRIVAEDSLSVVMPFPYEDSAVQLAVTELNDVGGLDFVGVQERIDQSIAALTHLQSIANPVSELSFYEWRSFEETIAKSLYTPHLSVGVSEVLGFSGSPFAQRELLNHASQSYLPLDHRKASASAFAYALTQRGIMLTSNEVRLQYDRYNASADLDQDTQEVLGGILDAIEAAMGVSPSK